MELTAAGQSENSTRFPFILNLRTFNYRNFSCVANIQKNSQLSHYVRKIGCVSENANKFAFLSTCTIFVRRYGRLYRREIGGKSGQERAMRCGKHR